uniref:hypothetical protein n=1 Tax=Phocaeicola massiliensis TaxID=204516 RepID=UPI001E603F76
FSFIIFFILQIYKIKIRDSNLNPVFPIYTKYFIVPKKDLDLFPEKQWQQQILPLFFIITVITLK